MSEPTVSKSQLFKPVILIRSRHTIVRGISSLGSHSITTSFISSLVNRATSKFNFFRRLVLSVSPSQWKSGWCVVDGENGKMIFVPLMLSPFCLLLLVRQDTYTVNLFAFYFCRLIGNWRFFCNFRSSVDVIQPRVPLPSCGVLLTPQV